MAHEPPPILLIEDEDDDVQFVRRALNARHIVNPIVVIPDVESARSYLRRSAEAHELPIITVIDIYLPGGASGLDLLVWMREQPELASVPAVILTVSTDRSHEAQASRFNAALVLHKPITPDLLTDAITALGITLTPVSPQEGVAGVALKNLQQ